MIDKLINIYREFSDSTIEDLKILNTNGNKNILEMNILAYNNQINQYESIL